MADVKPNIKPTVIADGHEVFEIPVEEEELEVANSMGQSKIWAMKVCIHLLSRLYPAILTSGAPIPARAVGARERRRRAPGHVVRGQLVSSSMPLATKLTAGHSRQRSR